MKSFRLLLVCLGILFLDIASPSNACRDTRTTLHVNVTEVAENAIYFQNSTSKLSNIQTTLTGNLITSNVEKCLRTGTIFVEDDGCRYEINVTSYNIESISIIKQDRREVEITLPYEILEEDITKYEAGMRDILKVNVKVSIEYEIIIPDDPLE